MNNQGNQSTNNTKKEIIELLNNLNWLFEAHEGSAELAEINGNKVTIYFSGKCRSCDSNCIEEIIKAEFKGIEVIIR